METDPGTGPATPASPATSAPTSGQNRVADHEVFSCAAGALAQPSVPGPDLDLVEEDSAAAAEIEANFKRRLLGLRHLPRHLRAAVLRDARNERFLALKALSEKRRRARRLKYMLWRQRLPPGLG